MTSKRGWESIKREQRAGLIAAAIVLLVFPFWLPSGFVANMTASLGASAVAFWIAWAIARRRRRNADSSD